MAPVREKARVATWLKATREGAKADVTANMVVAIRAVVFILSKLLKRCDSDIFLFSSLTDFVGCMDEDDDLVLSRTGKIFLADGWSICLCVGNKGEEKKNYFRDLF